MSTFINIFKKFELKIYLSRSVVLYEKIVLNCYKFACFGAVAQLVER